MGKEPSITELLEIVAAAATRALRGFSPGLKRVTIVVHDLAPEPGDFVAHMTTLGVSKHIERESLAAAEALERAAAWTRQNWHLGTTILGDQ